MQTTEEHTREDNQTSQSPTSDPSQARIDSPATETPSATLPHRKSGRGMSLRRRLGLKIEADESERQVPSDDGTQRRSGEDDQIREPAEEWWKVEYRAPPPGHLGAHAIARDENQHTIPTTSSPRGLERRDAIPSQAKPTTSTDRPHLHETPERAKKIRGDLYDSSTSHSSPNPKRKIMDLQDIEAGSFPSMGVAKELKRFHETNEEHGHEGESALGRTLRTAVVTPSKLLRPMKKIDIQAGSGSSTSVIPSLEKPATTMSTKASESA